MIEFVRSYSGCKDPGFSTEAVGQVLGSDYTDRRMYLNDFDFGSVPTKTLKKVVQYMCASLRASRIEYELWTNRADKALSIHEAACRELAPRLAESVGVSVQDAHDWLYYEGTMTGNEDITVLIKQWHDEH